MPLNQDSFLHSCPLVKAGDQVNRGQLLADDNFAQGGMLTIGRLRDRFFEEGNRPKRP